MTLTLLAVSLNEQPLSQPITAHFDGSGGSIGRADHNTMALPDPERQISRLQAEIVASGNGFLIRNLGAANPIVVSGRLLQQNESAPLAHGDEIRIGGYQLHVDGTVRPQALEVTRGRAMLSAAQGMPAPPAPPVPRPGPMPPRGSVEVDPFADLLSPHRPAATPPAGGDVRPVPAGAPGPTSANRGNPFADLLDDRSASAPPASADPFADLLAPAPQPTRPNHATHAPTRPVSPIDDPFADLLPPPAGVQPGSAGLNARPSASGALLPDDFDPFAAPAPPSFSQAAPKPADPFSDLMPTPAAASINALFDLEDSGHNDPLAHFLSTPAAPAVAGGKGLGGGISTDPLLALFDEPAPAPVAAAPSEFGRASPLNAAFEPPRAAPAAAAASAAQAATAVPLPSPAPPPVPAETVFASLRSAPAQGVATTAPLSTVSSMAAPAAGGDADALWNAFCEGAGLQMSLPPGAGAQRFRDIGRILQSAVAGTLGLMAVRASTRHELRAAVTVIQARENNPLKFSPDARAALDALLQPALRGFLEGPAAMEDAMQDLMGHSIGTVAGMRAALEGMLDRFAPEELEARLVGKSMFENLLPGTRKARLWDLYLQHHGTIREDAQENFHAVFGKAFLAAYEQQVDQLRSKRKA